jgi:hypothetical protein
MPECYSILSGQEETSDHEQETMADNSVCPMVLLEKRELRELRDFDLPSFIFTIFQSTSNNAPWSMVYRLWSGFPSFTIYGQISSTVDRRSSLVYRRRITGVRRPGRRMRTAKIRHTTSIPIPITPAAINGRFVGTMKK